MLLPNDAAVTTHTEKDLQYLMDLFSQACKDFGLVISLKTNIMGQDVNLSQAIKLMTMD